MPQNIIFDEIRHLKGPEIELKGLQSFEQLLEIYKNKKISNKQMYKYMLEDYLGFKETATMYFFKPKTNFDFVLFVEGREIEVKHLCDKKFIEIDGVKYYNICCVSKNSFLLSSKILLVI